MKSKEWLLLNAVECWLYHYSKEGDYTAQYEELREALRIAYQAELDLLKDADNPAPTVPRTTRKRPTTKSN